MQHANQRFYLAPDTRELIVSLGRAYGSTFATSQPSVELKVKRRGCFTSSCFTWNSYALDEDRRAHFKIPEELTVDSMKFPRGFYDIEVFVKGCHVDNLEMVKAPGYYVTDSMTSETDGECDTELWCEPSCDVNCKKHVGPPVCPNECADGTCGCLYDVKDNCPTCLKKYSVAEVALTKGYGY